MEVGIYHKLLRVSAVVVTLVLLFDGGFFSPLTKQLSDNAIFYVANSVTGMSARVEENELNKITTELTEWESSLAEREAALESREISVRDFNQTGTTDYSTYILSAILFILTTLIVLNYILDWMRIRKIRYEEKTA